MNKNVPRRLMIVLTILSCVALSSAINQKPTALAAPIAPNFSGTLTPSDVYVDTSVVSLRISYLGGVEPPRSYWYGSDGSGVSVTCPESSNLIRHYTYYGGSLVSVIDYFYVEACDRDPGEYRVIVGSDIDETFTINSRTTYIYTPLLRK